MIAQKQLISYWSNRFEISERVFESKNTSFYSRSHLNEYHKIIVFKTKKHNFIFYPEIYDKFFSRLSTLEKSIDLDRLNLYLPLLSLEHRGTDYYFYWMSDIPQNETVENLRLLKASDETALFTLQQSVTAYEKKLGDVDLKHHVVIGWFSNDKLLSVGSLIIEDGIADIGILTHPQERGKGLGKCVVQKLIAEGLKMGKLVQYTSMQKNTASVALAQSLGFNCFASETYWNINVKKASSSLQNLADEKNLSQ